MAALERMLRENPELIRARSTRRHRSTLLLYVGANGVEDYRQRSPKNAVEIAEVLLKAGADVNAVGEMYGGSTTLGLVATSVHPLRTGVQEALIDTLLAHGASFEVAVAPHYTAGSVVNACLANGRGRAAAQLAERGARLDLEGAAGVGRMDVVRSFFNEDGSLKTGATKEQMKSGFNWACEYGSTRIVDFLLQRWYRCRRSTARGDRAALGIAWRSCCGGKVIAGTKGASRCRRRDLERYSAGMGASRLAQSVARDFERRLLRGGGSAGCCGLAGEAGVACF